MKKANNKHKIGDVEIILTFFGKHKFNKANFDVFEPTYSSIRKIYPKNKIQIYSDIDIKINKSDNNLYINKIRSVFDIKNPRYGHRSSNYYRLWGAIKSKSKVVIYLDADFEILSKEFKLIEVFAEDYGMAIASNPRFTDRVDRKVGVDVLNRNYKKSDTSKGLGFTFNAGLWAVDTSNKKAIDALKFALKKSLVWFERGNTTFYNSFRIKKFNPYLLPPQWCIGNIEIMDGRHL